MFWNRRDRKLLRFSVLMRGAFRFRALNIRLFPFSAKFYAIVRRLGKFSLSLLLHSVLHYLCLHALMERKKQIIRYVLLLASLVMLISVIAPHHHHSDGMPCYKSLTEAHHGGGSHDPGCERHNLAFFTSFHAAQIDLASSHFLFPLFILYDYVYPPAPTFTEQLFSREKNIYIESLHDTWIASASGLRAPPAV